MSEKMIENNKVSVIGEIVSGFTFSHEVFGEGFYMVDVAVNRLSEQADIIPLMVSERLLDIHQDYTGNTIEALGQHQPVLDALVTVVGAELSKSLNGVTRIVLMDIQKAFRHHKRYDISLLTQSVHSNIYHIKAFSKYLVAKGKA